METTPTMIPMFNLTLSSRYVPSSDPTGRSYILVLFTFIGKAETSVIEILGAYGSAQDIAFDCDYEGTLLSLKEDLGEMDGLSVLECTPSDTGAGLEIQTVRSMIPEEEKAVSEAQDFSGIQDYWETLYTQVRCLRCNNLLSNHRRVSGINSICPSSPLSQIRST